MVIRGEYYTLYFNLLLYKLFTSSTSGEKIVTLLKNGSPVGKGKIVATGTTGVSHGHPIPAGMVKVVILEINDEIAPPVLSPFDNYDDFVEVGQFSCWPADELKYT